MRIIIRWVKLSSFRIMQVVVYALLVMLAISTPAAGIYEWNVFSLQGNADNLAWAYNGTVANGTVNGSV